jgi:hypothetical protein
MTDIHCEDCDVLDHATATQDDARAHELTHPNHEVIIHVR